MWTIPCALIKCTDHITWTVICTLRGPLSAHYVDYYLHITWTDLHVKWAVLHITWTVLHINWTYTHYMDCSLLITWTVLHIKCMVCTCAVLARVFFTDSLLFVI